MLLLSRATATLAWNPFSKSFSQAFQVIIMHRDLLCHGCMIIKLGKKTCYCAYVDNQFIHHKIAKHWVSIPCQLEGTVLYLLPSSLWGLQMIYLELGIYLLGWSVNTKIIGVNLEYSFRCTPAALRCKSIDVGWKLCNEKVKEEKSNSVTSV